MPVTDGSTFSRRMTLDTVSADASAGSATNSYSTPTAAHASPCRRAYSSPAGVPPTSTAARWTRRPAAANSSTRAFTSRFARAASAFPSMIAAAIAWRVYRNRAVLAERGAGGGPVFARRPRQDSSCRNLRAVYTGP